MPVPSFSMRRWLRKSSSFERSRTFIFFVARHVSDAPAVDEAERVLALSAIDWLLISLGATSKARVCAGGGRGRKSGGRAAERGRARTGERGQRDSSFRTRVR